MNTVECGAPFCIQDTHASRVFCSRHLLLLNADQQGALNDAWRAKVRRDEGADIKWHKARERAIEIVSAQIVIARRA